MARQVRDWLHEQDRRHLPVLQSNRVEERTVGQRWQRCFPAVLGIEEVMVKAVHRRGRLPRPVPGERAVAKSQMELLELLRPKSFFAKKKLTKLEVAFGKSTADDPPVARPRSRFECLGKDVPCPFARCRHHLAIDVNEIGSVKVNFRGWPTLDMEETCSLNVAARGPQTIETVARLMNLSTERIRTIERDARRKLARALDPERILRGPRKPT